MKVWVKILLFSVIGTFGIQTITNAALNIVLTQGVSKAVPIAIVPFSGDKTDPNALDNVSAVISNDLQNSGRFKVLNPATLPSSPSSTQQVDYSVWRTVGADNIVLGQVQPLAGNRYQISFKLLNVFSGQVTHMLHDNADSKYVLLAQQYTVDGPQLRRLAHHMADLIYQKLTGVKGVFSTRIAYILVHQLPGQTKQYNLAVADQDGYNPQSLLTSAEPIMSPAWAHDGRRIAYVSFENNRSQIFIQNIISGQRQLLSANSGINGAPAWSPDDSALAMVLSKNGNTNIFVKDITSGQLQQVTHSQSINTEPSWSPDGKTLLFTSDRGGEPQIYQVNLASGQVHRLTFNGNYNARASFTPDNQSIVFLHRADGGYNIALQDLQSGTVLTLTDSGRDESPSIAPNGSMVLYGNEYGKLGIVSTDSRIKLRLPSKEGDVQDPAWSPFLQ